MPKKNRSKRNGKKEFAENPKGLVGSRNLAILNAAWRKHPDLVRRFIEQQKDYDQLCTEIAYALKTRTKELNIAIAAVTHRTKSLDSFLEKITRKEYSEPFSEITDFAGARVVTLYKNDLDRVEEVINDDFEILERVDKIGSRSVDQFGYGSVHFVVRLSSDSLGARYDNLKQIKCEIQIRTVLQDAWAIIQHHLVYKKESEVPEHMLRKLNGLAALLEVADDQYQHLFDLRKSYIEDIRELKSRPDEFLKTALNADALVEYLHWKFPDRKLESYDGVLNTINAAIDHRKFSTLRDLENAIEKTAPDREELRVSRLAPSQVPASTELVWALQLVDSHFRFDDHFPTGTESILLMLRDGFSFPESE